ncbi:MAG: HAD hydrolase-like protein [Candidatus Woesearchaeota archaeon]
MLKAIFFDMDGVWADSLEPGLERMIAESAKHGKKISASPEDVRQQGIMALLKQNDLPLWKGLWYFKNVQEEMARTHAYREIKPIEGMIKLLLEIRDGCKIGIVTSNLRGNVDDFLSAHSLEVDYIYTRALPLNIPFFGKPYKLERGRKASGARKEEVLFIGDELPDHRAAIINGIPFVAYAGPGSYTTGKVFAERNVPQDYIVESPSELQRTILMRK